MPRLEVVVQMHGKPAADAGGGKLRVLGWEEFLALGDDVPEAELEARIEGAEARRRLHAHLHVGHDRRAEGRDDHAHEHRVDGRLAHPDA